MALLTEDPKKEKTIRLYDRSGQAWLSANQISVFFDEQILNYWLKHFQFFHVHEYYSVLK